MIKYVQLGYVVHSRHSPNSGAHTRNGELMNWNSGILPHALRLNDHQFKK